MTYTKTTLLPCTPDEAFALITEPERLRRWQTVSAFVDLRAGGSYRWSVTPGHVAVGTYREVEPGHRIVFGWGWEGSSDLPPDTSTVTITVEPAEGGSRITLEHAGLTAEQAVAHAEGWDHYFDRLETAAVKGDAGPDEWAFAPENLDPVVAAEATLAVLQPVLRNLTAQDRDRPTPCDDVTCHQMVEHLATSLIQVGSMAGAAVADPQDRAPESRISQVAADVIDAWRGVDLDSSIDGPSGEMPASFAAGILPLELLLHGWDIAQATGQTQHVSDELVGFVRKISEDVVAGGRGKSFGDEVAPLAAATALDRFAAFAGRVPISA
ncbi:TIGR03086 family metal-binding protein [Aeromicrobium sp.]|uniref:TIGR03086 family metal-binding protein n=1 Tax=Aeromicrobium sp. TaxID=1871063 RepID=UPI003D6A78F1